MAEKTEPQGSRDEKEFVRPPLDLWQDFKDGMRFLCFNPQGNAVIMPLLLIIESLALKIITAKVPYTEIDYKAYMEQIEMITMDGELDYSQIRGGTGPLVYPAGHVLLYKLMYKITKGMNLLHEGQTIFRYLYIGTLSLQMIIYYQLQLPPWCVVLACLSKRLHSIYVLRLFNDCFTTFFMVLTVVLLMQATKRRSALISMISSLTYSVAISIKMNALLYLPAFMVSIFLINERQLAVTALCAMIAIAWQVLVALPFLKTYPTEYLQSAFNFSRSFMFKWSVNWQMIDEDGFDSIIFHKSLLLSQLVGILAVIFFRYPCLLNDLRSSVIHPFSKSIPGVKLGDTVPYLLVTTNYIGVIFSRSLHYQFLTWYHWTIPILMNYSRIPWFLGPIWYILHEFCWNSYPPNAQASTLLLLLNSTMLLMLAINSLNCSIHKNTNQKKEQ